MHVRCRGLIKSMSDYTFVRSGLSTPPARLSHSTSYVALLYVFDDLPLPFVLLAFFGTEAVGAALVDDVGSGPMPRDVEVASAKEAELKLAVGFDAKETGFDGSTGAAGAVGGTASTNAGTGFAGSTGGGGGVPT